MTTIVRIEAIGVILSTAGLSILHLKVDGKEISIQLGHTVDYVVPELATT